MIIDQHRFGKSFEFWSVNSPGYTYTMTVKGTAGESLKIWWGDGNDNEYIFTGSSEVITHVYDVGVFTQRWAVKKEVLTTLNAATQNLNGDISKELDGFYNIVELYIYNNNLSGNLTDFDVSRWVNIQYFLISVNNFTGSISSWDLSVWVNLRYLWLQNNSFTGSVSGWDLSGWVNLRRIQINSNSFTGLNSLYANEIFDNRLIFPSLSKIVFTYGNSETLTGTYQQPNVGTYSGNINDLTEVEINNLKAGTDYDGAGTNTPWSTLEQVWVLVNLEVSSTDSTKRYAFTITY